VAWQPQPEPSWVELIAGAVSDTARRPTAAIDTVRGGLSEVRSVAGRLTGVAGGLFAAGLTAARPAPGTPLNVVIGAQRRFASVATDLDDYRRIRKTHGGTVNDVVLAAVAGALRTWLLTRGESVSTATIVRAMVPVSVRDVDESGPTSAVTNRVSSYLVDLPVGEPSPVMRLHQVSYRMKAHKETGKAVGADALVGLAGFAPPTLHALGARAASSMSKRWFNLVVTNVPGPQQPLYADGARMLATFPVVPLAKTQAVSIGLTSYDGQVFYGLNADRDAMPDIDVLAQCIVDAVAELLVTVR
jgi:WS/DGAT/MGAT family acyltransferase